MSCPDCGASVEEDQQFCRSCGRDLLPDVPRRMRPQVVMLMTFMLTFVGVGVALSGDMASIRWLKFTGIFIALAGMFSIIAASILIGMRESGSQKRKTPDVPVTLDRATTNKLLPIGENDFVPSVVENTTDLLEFPTQPEQVLVGRRK